MKQLILVVVACVLVLQEGNTLAGQFMPKTNGISGSYIVTVNGGNNLFPVRDYAIQLGGSVVGAVWGNLSFGFALQSSEAVAATLAQDPRVTFVEQNEVAHVQQNYVDAPHQLCPATQAYPSQTCANGSIPWQLDAMDAFYRGSNYLDGQYRYQYTGYGVRIYIVDSGIHDHPDLSGRIRPGVDLVNDGHGTDDVYGHGTISASIAAGTRMGPAKNAELVPVRVFQVADPNSQQLVLALNWIADDLWVRSPPMTVVVNFPFQLDGINKNIDNQIQGLASRGVVVVGATGHNAENSCNHSPSNLSQVITPGAVQRTSPYESGPKYAIWPSSGAGTCLAFMAPGVDVGGRHGVYDAYNCDPGWTGTSWATALTTGIAALYREAYSSSSPSEIKQYMIEQSNHDPIAGNMRGAPMRLLQPPGYFVVMDCNPQGGWQ
jgi:hypothetical protein